MTLDEQTAESISSRSSATSPDNIDHHLVSKVMSSKAASEGTPVAQGVDNSKTADEDKELIERRRYTAIEKGKGQAVSRDLSENEHEHEEDDDSESDSMADDDEDQDDLEDDLVC